MRKDFKDSPKFKDKQPRRGSPTSGPSGWLWMLVGLLVGLFVAFLVYINTRVSDDLVDVAKPVAPPPAKEAEEQPKESPKLEENKPKLGFYSELPKRKVEVKDDPPSAAAPSAATAPSKASITIQAGSFRRFEDADKRKATLALLGLVSRIDQVPAQTGSLYRVVAGPFADRKEAENTRELLARNKIESVMHR